MSPKKRIPKLDLQFGNPAFLHPFIPSSVLDEPLSLLDSDLNYQHNAGLPELKDALKLANLKAGNVKNFKGYECIVGNGASQVIQALIYAYGKHVNADARGEDHVLRVGAEAPRFSRFKDFTRFSTVGEFVTDYGIAPDLDIVTIPNNPDGDLFEKSDDSLDCYKMHDLCYYWPQYLPKGVMRPRKDEIMVFSASKAFGLAGIRIGWAWVSDPTIAARAKEFIELQTSDVSTAAQVALCGFLSVVDLEEFLNKGKAELDRRWSELRPRLNALKISVKADYGMFLYGRLRGEAAEMYTLPGLLREHAGILTIAGDAFGDSPEWARINIGCSEADFDELLERLDRLTEQGIGNASGLSSKKARPKKSPRLQSTELKRS